jgi:hypothetical protein
MNSFHTPHISSLINQHIIGQVSAGNINVNLRPYAVIEKAFILFLFYFIVFYLILSIFCLLIYALYSF